MKQRILIGLLALMLLLSACGKEKGPAEAVDFDNDKSLIETYDSYEARSGSFLLTEKTGICWVSEEKLSAEESEFLHFLAQQFAAAELPMGKLLSCRQGKSGKAGEILLCWDASVPAEGYEMRND